MTKKQENQTILPPTAAETEIPEDLHEADTKPVDAPPTESAVPLDPKEEARRRSREDLERKRRTNHRGNKR